jgi:hypothetical protein
MARRWPMRSIGFARRGIWTASGDTNSRCKIQIEALAKPTSAH